MSSHAPPPPAALDWVRTVLPSGARVVRAEPLKGGLTSVVHALTVEHGGRTRDVVLRRIRTDAEWAEWSAGAVAKEVRVLQSLESHTIPAPRVLGATDDPAHGGPALLLTRVPGVPSLMPADREAWLRQMARMLHRIHALPVQAPPFTSWLDVATRRPPHDAQRAMLWEEAHAAMSAPRAAPEACFLHRDYQHFNLLWTGSALTGVVDWVEACMGPPEVDVGHCRLNLAVLFSAEVAEQFREMYEAEAGTSLDPWWDLQSLLAYGSSWRDFIPLQVAGLAPVDTEHMTERVEAVIDGVLRRL